MLQLNYLLNVLRLVFFIVVYVLFVLRLFRSFITSLFYTTYDKKFLKQFRHFTITPNESWLDLIFTVFLLLPNFLQFIKVYFLSTGPANSSSENSKNQRACAQMNTNTYTFFRCQILRPCISPLHLSSHQLNEGIFSKCPAIGPHLDHASLLDDSTQVLFHTFCNFKIRINLV